MNEPLTPTFDEDWASHCPTPSEDSPPHEEESVVDESIHVFKQDALDYARHHQIFQPLGISIKSIISTIELQGYELPDAEDDDHLTPFNIYCDPKIIDDFELHGYAQHIIQGDLTLLDASFIHDFYYTSIEKTVKVPIPLLRNDNEFDLATYLDVRKRYKDICSAQTILPEEPLEDNRDESMEFPKASYLTLELLEGETEFEPCDDLDNGYLQAVNLMNTLLAEDAHFDTSLHHFRDRIRLVSPPLSPIVQPVEPFIPWEAAAKIDTPDSDIPSLLEADIAAAETAILEAQSPEVHDDDMVQRALYTSSDISIPSPSHVRISTIRMEPPLLRFTSHTPHEIPVIDLTEDNVITTQIKPGIDLDGVQCDDINIINNELEKLCSAKAEALNKSINQEQLHDQDAALRVRVPPMDFTRPATPWSCSTVDIPTCLFQLLSIFPNAFNRLEKTCQSEKYANRLKWKPWATNPPKTILHETIPLDGGFLRALDLWLAQDVHLSFQPTPRFSCLIPDVSDDDLLEPLASESPRKTIKETLWPSKPNETFPTPLKSTLVSASMRLPTPREPPAYHHSTEIQTSTSIGFLTLSKEPINSLPRLIDKGPVVKKRPGDILSDIKSLKRMRKALPSQSNDSRTRTEILSCQPSENKAEQHLANFMNIMAVPKRKRVPKESMFFEVQDQVPGPAPGRDRPGYSQSRPSNPPLLSLQR